MKKHFFDQLKQCMARNTSQVAVVVLYVDGLARINHTYGYSIVKQTEQEVLARLQQFLGWELFIFQIEYNRFAVIVEQMTTAEDVLQVATELVELFANPVILEPYEFYLQPRASISMYPTHGMDAETILKNAETACYFLQSQKVRKVNMFTSEMNVTMFKRVFFENNLREALKNDEFLMYYQPKIDVRSGKVISLECLIRWNHPEMGMVSPGDFIPLAEETGLIAQIGEKVICEASKFTRKLMEEGYEIAVSLNVSVQQFFMTNIVEQIKQAIEANNLLPHLLGIEITESDSMHSMDEVIQLLKQIKQLGVTIYLDDFGTGYSSLKYLQQLPIDVIKIDQSFVKNSTENQIDETIIRSIIGISKKMGLKIVAEGVESQQQLKFLRQLDCDIVQGYLFSKPMPEHEVISYLSRTVHSVK